MGKYWWFFHSQWLQWHLVGKDPCKFLLYDHKLLLHGKQKVGRWLVFQQHKLHSGKCLQKCSYLQYKRYCPTCRVHYKLHSEGCIFQVFHIDRDLGKSHLMKERILQNSIDHWVCKHYRHCNWFHPSKVVWCNFWSNYRRLQYHGNHSLQHKPRVISNAITSFAVIFLGAIVIVITGCSIQNDGIIAISSWRIASSNIVALIRGGTNYRVGSNAKSNVASIITSAKIRIVAWFSIIWIWLSAISSQRIANSNFMTLIQCSANNCYSLARSSEASIIISAKTIITARFSIIWIWIWAKSSIRIACSYFMAFIRCITRDICSTTDSKSATIILSAEQTIIAGCSIGYKRIGAILKLQDPKHQLYGNYLRVHIRCIFRDILQSGIDPSQWLNYHHHRQFHLVCRL